MTKTATTKMEVVHFKKQEIQATIVDNQVVVGLHSLCDNLGIDYSGQLQRIKRRSVLAKTLGTAPMVAMDGKVRDMAYITLRGLTTWLVTIDTSRMPEKKKRSVERYQEEAADVLEQHFAPRLKEHFNLGHDTQGSVGPAYNDFTRPRTPSGEVEVYSPPLTQADLIAAIAENNKQIFTMLPEMMKAVMESGGRNSLSRQINRSIKVNVAEQVAEKGIEVETSLTKEAKSLRKLVKSVSKRMEEISVDQEFNGNEFDKLKRKVTGIVKSVNSLIKNATATQEELVEIRSDIKMLRRVIGEDQTKDKKKKKGRTIN